MSATVAPRKHYRPTESPWVFAGPACRILAVSYPTIRGLVARGVITTRRLPGCRIEFSRADIERLRDQSIRPATAPEREPDEEHEDQR